MGARAHEAARMRIGGLPVNGARGSGGAAYDWAERRGPRWMWRYLPVKSGVARVVCMGRELK